MTKTEGMMTEIDLVIPMVFPQDPEWQRAYRRSHTGDATKNVRWRSWGTEELLVRCAAKYMPWIRRIHILLASETQVQDWMEEMENGGLGTENGKAPEMKIVFHREFIPAKCLPCFTSPCIEMFLHRIPGLTEHFIYANDDMFPLSPLEPEDFFRAIHNSQFIIHNPSAQETENGEAANRQMLLPCQHLTERAYPSSPNLFQKKCMNQQNMVAGAFGKRYAKTLFKNGHSFAPMLKSVCEEVWRRHGDEIRRHLSPVDRNEHSYSQYVYVLYQHFSGLYVDYAPKQQYVGRDMRADALKAVIRDADTGILCLNDDEHIDNWEKMARVARHEIAAKLGVAVREQKDRLACIIHYNTPKLTRAAVLSLWKHTPGVRVTVLDNSDRLPISACGQWRDLLRNPLVTVIDNTGGQCIDFNAWLRTFPDREPSPGNDYGSAKHCRSVQWLCDNVGEPFLLMDSDVLVKRDVSAFWQHGGCAWVGETGENVKRRFGYDFRKVQPFLCWLNVPMMRRHGIRYFNAEWMWNLTSKKPNHRYDTGAWFFRAVKEAGLPAKEVKLDDYILHLGHGSWREKRPMEWVLAHRRLWE